MIRLLPAAMILPLPALADVPRVMTDIAPIHSLTAQVMGDLGTPALLLPPGADPHDFALRPSDAATLGDADIVIWVGHGLTPWLEEPLETLAESAVHFSLLETEGWTTLPFRDLASFGAGHGDAHDHDKNDDHGHDDHGHDDHDDDHDGHADHGDHDHGDFDPHGWLDPVVAAIWVDHIAAELAALDPDNAATYAANAAATTERLDALQQQIGAQLAEVSDAGYLLPHDGYQYFEARFGLTAHGAIAGVDGMTPGPAQIAMLRAEMSEASIACVFSDAAIGDRWAAVITEGTEANTTMIDGIGLGLEAGEDLYAALLTGLADNFASCLAR